MRTLIQCVQCLSVASVILVGRLGKLGNTDITEKHENTESVCSVFVSGLSDSSVGGIESTVPVYGSSAQEAKALKETLQHDQWLKGKRICLWSWCV